MAGKVLCTLAPALMLAAPGRHYRAHQGGNYSHSRSKLAPRDQQEIGWNSLANGSPTCPGRAASESSPAVRSCLAPMGAREYHLLFVQK